MIGYGGTGVKQKTVTFGEIMMRLTPERYLRFTQADRLEAVFGGGEANVAVSLAQFGMEAVFVTKLPGHELGQAAVNYLRGQGVDTRYILRSDGRLGLYYLERGAAQRPDKVIYDRKDSAFALSEWEEYDWEAILEGAGWLHVTGITPALSPQTERMTESLLKLAKEKGITVSFDPNYRQKLWSLEKAKEVTERLLPYVDVCLTGLQGNAVLGIPDAAPEEMASLTAGAQSEAVRVAAEETAERLVSRYGFSHVALTMRQSRSASDNGWSAMLYQDGRAYYSRQYEMHLVDRVGGGDAFAAGLIYGLQSGFDGQHTIEFAAAAGCLKHTVEGDANQVTAEEIEALVAGAGDGRVQR